MKRIIIGTAGHIDHGKTSLVRALTGIDADRLKEEKERGITIDIGFADLTVGDVHFGFVDVPGHERFVKNMLAGVHGIDLVMLVVAADEGLMPQTREHFEICQLLAVKSGLIVITKIDTVDEEMLELVEAEIQEYVAASFLANAPILRVSSKSGEGVENLKKALVAQAHKVTARDANAIARLPIDRIFTIKGFGTVVTGTLISGQIKIGDLLDLLPAPQSVKVRGLQVHSKSTTEAKAGERTAINLQGVEVAEIARGQVLVTADRLLATNLLDVRLKLLSSAPKPLKTRARVRLHHGTAEIIARVILLGPSEIQPGQSAWVQLRCDHPIVALPQDHFIIRSYSPAITMGGGIVLDVLPDKHRKRDVNIAVESLQALEQADALEKIALLVEMAGERGSSQKELAARTGATDEILQQAATQFTKNRRLIFAATNPFLLIARAPFENLCKRVRELLKSFHKKEPLATGLGRGELREKIFAKLPPEIFRAVIQSLTERAEIVAEKDVLRLASHRVSLSAEEQAAKDHLANLFLQSGLQPISLEDAKQKAAPQFGIDAPRAQKFAQMLINSGELMRIGELIFHRQALENLRGTLQTYKASHGAKIDVGVFKDLTGVSRKFAIPLLEYLDRQRVTRRVGEAREIL